MLEQSDYQDVAASSGREAARSQDAVWRTIARTWRGITAGLRARWGLFIAVAAGVFALQILLPPVVLSAVHRWADYFTFNAWLPELPRYLAAGDVTWQRKLDFLPGLALFGFSADSPFGGTDWGFAVTVADLARFVLLALLFGGYFALRAHCRAHAGAGRFNPVLGRKDGAAGTFAGALGFSTGGCTVVGCGAPVVPVVGLAFSGLTSGTLAALAQTSRIATALIFIAVALGGVYLGWRASRSAIAG
jgi:hypothetical protein